jgi:hypothetical protein
MRKDLGNERSRALDASKKWKNGHGSRSCAKSARHFSQSRSKKQNTRFDNFCVLLRRDGHSQLVYKHAISTIMPGHPIQLFEGADEPPAGDKV